MLVVVRKPPTEFTVNGTIPDKLIKDLFRDYGADNVRVEYDDLVNVMDMDWYKEEAAKDSPGKALRFLSQAQWPYTSRTSRKT